MDKAAALEMRSRLQHGMPSAFTSKRSAGFGQSDDGNSDDDDVETDSDDDVTTTMRRPESVKAWWKDL